jgi:hypothetical protein
MKHKRKVKYMSVFVVLTQTNNSKLESLIKEKFPNDHYMLSPQQWLISADKTAKILSEELLIPNKENGSGPAIVFATSSYYGMANPAIWDWLKTKLEKSDG